MYIKRKNKFWIVSDYILKNIFTNKSSANVKFKCWNQLQNYSHLLKLYETLLFFSILILITCIIYLPSACARLNSIIKLGRSRNWSVEVIINTVWNFEKARLRKIWRVSVWYNVKVSQFSITCTYSDRNNYFGYWILVERGAWLLWWNLFFSIKKMLYVIYSSPKR